MSTAHPILRLPPRKYLHECFAYRGGKLWWKRRPRNHFKTVNRWHGWNTSYAGTVVGTINQNGYHRVGIRGIFYLLHRLVWKLRTGKEPPEFLDHIDGDKSNNAFNNLRPATRTKQKWNSKTHKNNTSGYRGVSKRKNGYIARIGPGGNQYLGTFDTAKKAAVVYRAAARKMHGNFYRGDSE
jgi:hypothetical protein